MAARRRRGRSWSRRLRRRLVQHRFTAAESLLGVVGMIIGLWLIWPSVGPQTVDHRKLWERSLSISRAASVLEADDAVEAGPSAPAALASVAISAKGTSLSSLGVRGTVGATQAQAVAYVEPATASEPEVVSSEALDALAAKVAEVERQVSRFGEPCHCRPERLAENLSPTGC